MYPAESNNHAKPADNGGFGIVSPFTEVSPPPSLDAEVQACADPVSGPFTEVIEEHPEARVHPTAIVEEGVRIGAGSSVWDNVHIRENARIGEQCIVGGKTTIAYEVSIGSRVKINSQAYICNGVTIGDGVMISAGVIFTNDRYPRAASPDLAHPLASEPDEDTLTTWVHPGATIGAGAVIGGGIEIGKFSMVGMGSVVTRTVPAFHLVVGNPARSVGTVCRCGQPTLGFGDIPLDQINEVVQCRRCGMRYHIRGAEVTEFNPPAGPVERQAQESNGWQSGD